MLGTIMRGNTNADLMGLSLEELVSELEAFYELSTDMVSVSSADGRFRRVNRAWEKAIGHPAGEIAGKRWLDFVHPDDVQKTIDAARSLSASDLAEFQNRYKHQDGHWVTLSWRSTAWSGGLTYAITRVVG